MNQNQNQPRYQVTPETTTRQIYDWILELKSISSRREDVQKLQQVLNDRLAK
jgi:hypothetical protein